MVQTAEVGAPWSPRPVLTACQVGPLGTLPFWKAPQLLMDPQQVWVPLVLNLLRALPGAVPRCARLCQRASLALEGPLPVSDGCFPGQAPHCSSPFVSKRVTVP